MDWHGGIGLRVEARTMGADFKPKGEPRTFPRVVLTRNPLSAENEKSDDAPGVRIICYIFQDHGGLGHKPLSRCGHQHCC